MFTTCVILTMLISFVFFFPLFYDLTDNGNSAKK